VPTITVSVPAVVIMVPKVTADRTVSYLSTGETIRALDYGVQACLVVLALAIGLAVRMPTDRTDRSHLGSGALSRPPRVTVR
jgi:uncharacterized membrane protein YjjB (DUF3815 family)